MGLHNTYLNLACNLISSHAVWRIIYKFKRLLKDTENCTETLILTSTNVKLDANSIVTAAILERLGFLQ